MIKINVNFNFSEDKQFDCFLRILFFKIKLLPSDEKNKKKKSSVKNINSTKNDKDDRNNSLKKEKKEKRSFTDVLQNVRIFIEPLPKFLRRLSKGIKIKRLSVVWCISTDDACETALKYAKCCGCFYNVFRMINSICEVKVDKIRIFPDFVNENSYCVVFLRLQISIGRLFIGTLGYLVAIIIKYLNKNKKERLK